MPKPVNYYVGADGLPRSAASGAVLKQGVENTTRTTYKRVDKPNFTVKRKTARDNAKAQYLAQYDQYAPDAVGEIARTNKRVGASRDSMLNALNRAYAASMDIPLNATNRQILRSIYADEMSSAIGARNADFAKFQGQFAAGIGKKGKVPKI